MRTLLVVAALLFAVGATSPVGASALPPRASTTSVIAQGLPAAGAAGQTEIRKKKRKKSSKETAKFQEIGNATRGKEDLEIKVKVAKSDRTCELKIEWNDDSSSVDDDEAKSDKICEFNVSVPDERDAIGDARATVTVRDAAGKKVASAKKTFQVK